VEGVDGIKTGYTNASGFNLVTSVRRNGRHIVAVVLGGKSASSRDAYMRQLIESKIEEAANRRTAMDVAEADDQSGADAKPPVVSLAAAEAAAVLAPQAFFRRADTTATPEPRPTPGSNDPLKPVAVRTITVKAGTMRTAGIAASPAPLVAAAAAAGEADTPRVPPPAKPGTLGVLPAQVVAASYQDIAVPAASPEPTNTTASASIHPHSGWAIQIGAFEAEDEANQHLDAAQTKAKSMLSRADRYTERVTKGEKTYFRARFAGFDKDGAEAACKYLKHNDITCMTLKN
jgi:D-alanyl-D-alanine carboxypeptidase